ncbi:hypothetical protein ABBQ38_003771 [Trebouxia sp. C0009 RCD-2024]
MPLTSHIRRGGASKYMGLAMGQGRCPTSPQCFMLQGKTSRQNLPIAATTDGCKCVPQLVGFCLPVICVTGLKVKLVLKLKDIVRTPLGVTGTVIGVKLVEASQPETARLWVAYSSGLEAPLEPQLSAGQLSDLGYTKVSDADHVHRDISVLEADEAAWEVRKKELTEEAAQKAAEAAEPDKKGKDKKKT